MNGKRRAELKKNNLKKKKKKKKKGFLFEIHSVNQEFFFSKILTNFPKKLEPEEEKNMLFYIKNSCREITLAFFVFQKMKTN
jgi:hypothetical protein